MQFILEARRTWLFRSFLDLKQGDLLHNMSKILMHYLSSDLD